MDQFIIRDAIPSDAEGITFVHVNSWQTSYAGIVDQDFLDNISYEKRLDRRKEILKSKTMLHLVVLSGEQIVGFADVGPIRSESCEGLHVCENVGEIYAIYLLEDHKGKGCGKALFASCREWLKTNELKSFVVRALVDNVRARRFYEKEGGKIIRTTYINIGDKQYEEVSYLFPT